MSHVQANIHVLSVASMAPRFSDVNQSDVTGTVNIANPVAVADAVCAILARRYGTDADATVRRAFKDIEDAFWGRYPGLLQCDTPYHDLRHSLATALLMARLVDGYETVHGGDALELGRDLGTIAVLLALFHDIGFLRRSGEEHLNGATLIHDHELRSVQFSRMYLAQGAFSHLADQAELIQATNFSMAIRDTLGGLSGRLLVVGQLLGTADLVSQIAGRYYLERCRHFLYQEFVAAGVDRTISPDGEIRMIYATPEDLLRKTPGFYEHIVKRRLEEDFAQAYRYVAPHFRGEDHYAIAIRRNMDYLCDMIRRDDFSGLRRKPVPMMPAYIG